MKTLDKDSLLVYLRNVIELESSTHAQRKIIDQYEITCNSNRPHLKTLNAPNMPKRYHNYNHWSLWLFVIVLVLAFIVAIVAGEIAKVSPGNWWWDDPAHVDWKESRIFWTNILKFCWVPVIAIALIAQMIAVLRYNIKWKVECKKVSREQARVHTHNAKIRKTYNKNLFNWTNSSTTGRNYLTKQLSETQAALDKLYEMDVIYPKYRYLSALTSIYEYIESGRCSELSGTNGAYNLYEDELRKNIVVAQLSEIINNLNSIRQNQYLLYKEVKKIQEDVANCSYQLSQIHGYVFELTELASLKTYYSGITARNSSIMAYWR